MRSAIVLSALPSALSLLAACSAPSAQPPAAAGTDRKAVPAPIESARIQARESFAPQYALEVVSGLPSGCAAFSRIDIERMNGSIEVSVWNSVPASDDVACTMIYGTVRNTVELGSDFESGRTYRVRVNGELEVPFTAQ